MKKPLVLIGLLGSLPLLHFAACGGSGSSTTPSTTPPTTQPPVTTPPTTQSPLLAQCGDPTPPPLYGMKLKIHVDNGYRKQLDSKPIVVNVNGYCGKVGLGGDSTRYCETRPEGNLQREACDGLVVGRASDTGRIGPTWTWNGQPCFAAGDTGGAAGCVNLPDNQFLIIARGPGIYLACASGAWPVAADGGSACGGFEVP